jgi:formylglycine-generating enzyme
MKATACAIFILLGSFCLAVCPEADLTGDCYVDLADLAVVAAQWLTGLELPPDMVFVPGGTFQMGDSFSEGELDEQPVHTVSLRPFSMSRCETTNGQYCDFLNDVRDELKVVDGGVYALSDRSNSYPYCDTHARDVGSQIDYNGTVFRVRAKDGRSMSKDPMVVVTWYGAAAYCNWRSQQESRKPCYDPSTWTCDFSKGGYHLPTEAQWEYAARGGLSGKRFPWGNTINHDHANYRANGSAYSYDTSPYTDDTYHPAFDGTYPHTAPAGYFEPNGYGLYDMTGNVGEWCNDWYAGDYYVSSPADNPRGPSSGEYRVLRGGSWYDRANGCRVASRNYNTPSYCIGLHGFRLVRDLD